MLVYKANNNLYEHLTTNKFSKYDVDALDKANKSIEAGDTVPHGIISIWSGPADIIPSGWKICDGENGTPDLRGRFIRGTVKNDSIKKKGGLEKVKLEIKHLPSHNHNHRHKNIHKHELKIRYGNHDAHHNHFGDWDKHGYSKKKNHKVEDPVPTLMSFQPLTTKNFKLKSDLISDSSKDHTDIDNTFYGKDGAHENRPPYYVLAYIMKL